MSPNLNMAGPGSLNLMVQNHSKQRSYHYQSGNEDSVAKKSQVSDQGPAAAQP